MILNQVKLSSLRYDPGVYGFDDSFFKTTTGVATISSNKIRLNATTIYSYLALRFGRLAMQLTIPIAPTAGQTREWGFADVNTSEFAKFEVSGTTFRAVSQDLSSGVTTTTNIAWNVAWSAAAVAYEIVWTHDYVEFLINGVQFAKHVRATQHVPDNALFLKIKNGSSDNLDVAFILVSNPQEALMPVDKADLLFTSYEAKSFSIGAQTDYSLKTSEGRFVVARKSGRIKTDIACIIKFNSASNDAIALGATEEYPFDNMLVTDIFVTTTGATALRLFAQ